MRYAQSGRASLSRSALLFLVTTVACSFDDPTSPGTGDELPGAHGATAAVLSQPVKQLSNKFAYVFANLPSWWAYTPDSTRSYNATGGAIRIQRLTPGSYQVEFDSRAGWGGGTLGFALTAYGMSPILCSLVGHSLDPTGLTLRVNVSCHLTTTLQPVDAYFTLLVVGSGSLMPRSAFAFGDQPSAPSYTPNPLASYTSSLGSINVTRSGAGIYGVDLATGQVSGSTVMVNAQAGFWNLCKVGQWKHTDTEVRCFDHSGAPHDATFWTLQVDGGRPGRRLGFAFADKSTTSAYTPNLRYSFNSSGGAITAFRTSVGRYHIEFDGLQKLSGHTETVHVTPWGTGPTACHVSGWGNGGGHLWVNVECRRLNGNLVDTRYNVLVIE